MEYRISKGGNGEVDTEAKEGLWRGWKREEGKKKVVIMNWRAWSSTWVKWGRDLEIRE